MKGKRTLLLIVVSIAIICCSIGLLVSYEAMWSLWRFETMTPPFADLRNLTGAAESISMGYDPLYVNPQDPWNRPLNQPRFVQYILAILNINLGHTIAIGILFIVLFFVGIFISLKEIDNSTAIGLASVIFSPAIVLGLERGNHDLFIFFLVSLALFLSSYPMRSGSVLLLAAFIKLFPVFALTYVFKYPKKTQIILFLSFITAFAIYILLNRADWPQVFNSTQKAYGIVAYGVRTYSKSSDITSYIPLMAIIVSSLVFYVNLLYLYGFRQGDRSYIDTFRVGAGIYLGTFLLGNNFAYRLMFLIFVIPQSIAWRKDATRGFISLITLVSIWVSCWSMWWKGIFPKDLIGAIDEIGNWVLFASLFYLFLSSLPLVFQKNMMAAVSITNIRKAPTGGLLLRLQNIYRR